MLPPHNRFPAFSAHKNKPARRDYTPHRRLGCKCRKKIKILFHNRILFVSAPAEFNLVIGQREYIIG